MLELAVFRVAA